MNAKIIFIALLWLCATFTSAQVTRQTGEEFITLKASTASLSEWFSVLKSKGYHLSYNNAMLDMTEEITLQQKTFSLHDFLNGILTKYDFTYKCDPQKKVLIQIKGIRKVLVSGILLNKETGETLHNYTVKLTDQKGKTCYAKEHAGRFSAEITPGKYTVSTTYLGYEPFSSYYQMNEDRRLRIQLTPNIYPIKEVVVKPHLISDGIHAPSTFKRLSVNANDPLAAISKLPGIVGTFSSGNLHINGGQHDENQILLDGIPLYHSHHNNSLVSLFNGDAVKNISFYDSFIPAQYEGRLSSVTDIKLKSGDSVKHHQHINIEMPAAGVTFDGPVVKNKLTYMLSGRHSWMDPLRKVFDNKPGLNRFFGDFTTKLTYYIDSTTTIHGVVYRSRDTFRDSVGNKDNQKILQWQGGIYSFGLKSKIKNKISYSANVGYADYLNKVFAPAIQIDSPTFIEEGMHRMHFKADFQQQLDEWVNLSYGVKFSREKFNLLASKDTVENNEHIVSQISLYTNARIRITPKLAGSAAINLVSYLPQHQPHFFSIQPRFTLKYFPNERHTFSLDFSRMEQFYHNICMDEMTVPADFRMPSIKGYKPSSSVHTEIGWRYSSPHFYTSVSTFYKRRYHILGIRRNLDLGLNEWDRFIMEGDAHSGGVKIRLNANFGKWDADMSYCFTRSKEWFDDFDGNKKHAALHDIPHLLNWGISYQLWKETFLSIGGYVKSGYLTNNFMDMFSSDVFYSRNKRTNCNYQLDLNFASTIATKSDKAKIKYKLGLFNVIGNPRKKELFDLYSWDTTKHCLPYFTLNVMF